MGYTPNWMHALYSVFFLVLLTACAEDSVELSVFEDKPLPKIPSASACEIIGDSLYIVGDDAPYLYILDATTLQLLDSVLLYPKKFRQKKRVNSKEKSDFESISSVEWNEEKALLIFGSGGTRKRQRGLVYFPQKKKIIKFDLEQFYSTLLRRANLSKDDLNCEGLAVNNNHFVLLNKPTNTLFMMKWNQVKSLLEGKTRELQVKKIFLALPRRNQHLLQLTGIDFSEFGELFFTAYSRNGSKPNQHYPQPRALIGKVKFSSINKSSTVYTFLAPPLNYKIEGITMLVDRRTDPTFIVVSDGELGYSRLIKCKIF